MPRGAWSDISVEIQVGFARVLRHSWKWIFSNQTEADYSNNIWRKKCKHWNNILILRKEEFLLVQNQKEYCRNKQFPLHSTRARNAFPCGIICLSLWRTEKSLPILVELSEIRLYLQFSDWLGNKRFPFGSKSIGKHWMQSDFE